MRLRQRVYRFLRQGVLRFLPPRGDARDGGRGTPAPQYWPPQTDPIPTPPRGKRRVWTRALGALFAALSLTVIAASAGLTWAFQALPAQPVIERASPPALVIEDKNGEVFARRGPIMGPPVTREDLPDHLVAAVLSIEDRRFYGHFGIDPVGVLRASVSNWKAGQIIEGGSTITQQLAKLTLGEGERTWWRKLQESALALRIETRFSKDEILSRYLNSVYLGSGVIGISGAARFYFGKQVQDLTLAEAAMLAGMIQAPSRLNPRHNEEAARARANAVLDAMLENGRIDSAAALAARLRPADPAPLAQTDIRGSWFADWITGEVAERVQDLYGPVRVRTTLDPAVQRIAEDIVARRLGKGGKTGRSTQAALVAMRPDGAVLAVVGGRDYRESQFNRAVQALRQPGSAFKIFVYLAALRQGYRLDTWLSDEPFEVNGWSPTNYDGRHHGEVTLAEAFARSLNVPTARLVQEVGVNRVIRAARDLGIRAKLAPHPSLALGTSEVTLLDLTAAYAAIRAGQMPVRPWGMLEFGREGHKDRFAVGPARMRPRPLDYQAELVSLLRGVVEHGTGRRAALGNGFAAGKTGTSQGHRDAWFIGFTDGVVVGVWVGNDDSSPMARGLVGGGLPAVIWKDFVSKARPLLDTGPHIVAALPELAPSDALSGSSSGPFLDASAGSSAEVGAEWTAGEEDSRDIAHESEQFVAGSPAQAMCDVNACAEAYRSFRASDCTYQPYEGPRTVCSIGTGGAESAGLTAQADDETRPLQPEEVAGLPERGASCDVNACSRAYRSFRASDCTYQPYQGPRTICSITGGSAERTRSTAQAGEGRRPSRSAVSETHASGAARTVAHGPPDRHAQWCMQRYGRYYNAGADRYLASDGNTYRCTSPHAHR